ncbi:MAG: PQQ-binding-like beta-propeller repeat protein [Pseudomonadota bacterium]
MILDQVTLARAGRLAIVAVAAAALCACSSNPIGGLFGGGDEGGEETAASDDEDKKERKLTRKEREAKEKAERISILALEETIEADPRLAGTLVEVPPSYRNASWPQPGGEADHTLHHLSAEGTLERAWRIDIKAEAGRRARLTSPPVVADGRVFVIDTAARVSAFDIESGERIWRTELTPEIEEKFRLREILGGPKAAHVGFGGGVAYDGGRVFISSGFGFVAALEAENGEELWRYATEAPVRTAPTAHRGAVYVVTNTNELLAINQSSGEKVWGFRSYEEAARIISSTSPAAAGDLLVAPFSSGELVAFLSESGRSVWNDTLARSTRLNALSTLNDIAGAPVIDRGLVYVVSHAGRLAAIDIRSGDRVWEAPIASLQMPWVAGDYIYVVSVDAELVCVQRESGAIVWVEQLQRYRNDKKRKGRIAWAGPVLAGGRLVLVSSDGELILAAPESGAVLEEKKLSEGSVIPPVVAEEKIFVLTEAGKLYAFN